MLAHLLVIERRRPAICRGNFVRLVLPIAVMICLVASVAHGTTYLSYEQWGGSYVDVEKNPLNADDDNLCWAAAAANVLQWTGWASQAGLDSGDEVFGLLRDHWTNDGGLMEYAWNWWFEGVNPSQGWQGWAQVDVPGGHLAGAAGPFAPRYHRTGLDSEALPAIDQYLRAGYGVALAVTQPGRSHTLTCWGFDYHENVYDGIWVTDSDDDRALTDPPDTLRYIPVTYDGARWFLQNPDGTATQYINEVQALAPEWASTEPEVPEPATAVLLASGSPWLLRRRRCRR